MFRVCSVANDMSTSAKYKEMKRNESANRKCYEGHKGTTRADVGPNISESNCGTTRIFTFEERPEVVPVLN